MKWTKRTKRKTDYSTRGQWIVHLPTAGPLRLSHITHPLEPGNHRDDKARAVFVTENFDKLYKSHPQVGAEIVESMTRAAVKTILSAFFDRPLVGTAYFVIKEAPVKIGDVDVYVGFPMYWFQPSSNASLVKPALRAAHVEYFKPTAGCLFTYMVAARVEPGSDGIAIVTSSQNPWWVHLTSSQVHALAHLLVSDAKAVYPTEFVPDKPFQAHWSVENVRFDFHYNPVTRNVHIDDVMGIVIAV